jgi:Ni,Fe-hydrogenase III large subunit
VRSATTRRSPILHAQCGILRELVLRAAQAFIGHRLMMDRVVPGGVAADLAWRGTAKLRALAWRDPCALSPELVEVYDNTPRC